MVGALNSKHLTYLKTKKFKILVGVLLLFGIGLFYIINLYNKPLKNIKKSSADINISAQQLLDDYQKDEILANKKYINNIIQISGEISNIKIDNGNSIIVLKNINGESSVMCHMLAEENLSILKLKKNSQIIVKGMCTGYLLDVILVRCILVNS